MAMTASRPSAPAFWAAAFVLTAATWASGAPTVVYPLYAEQWGLAPVVTTSVFAIYPIVLVIVLTVFGNVSDFIGRRSSILIGVAFLLVGTLAFALALDVTWLFAGRILQGIGVGLTVGAGGAALVDYNPYGPRVPGPLNTATQAVGLCLAAMLGALLIAFAPLPLHLTYWVLAAVFVVAGGLAFLLPAHNAADVEARGRWRPHGLAVPRTLRSVYLVSTLALTAAFGIGALFLSLGAQIGSVTTGGDSVVYGAILSGSFVLIGISAISATRFSSRTAIRAGAIAAILSGATLTVAAVGQSLAMFVAASVFGGLGYGLLAAGGIGLAASSAPAHHRAQLLSAVFLVGYFLQGCLAVGGGAIATATTLALGVAVVSAIVAVLAIAGLIAVAVVARRSARPAAARAERVVDGRS